MTDVDDHPLQFEAPTSRSRDLVETEPSPSLHLSSPAPELTTEELPSPDAPGPAENEASSRPTSPRRSPSARSDKPAVQLAAPCCQATDGLAVLVGNLRSDVDETLLKDRLTQLLQRRMLQVSVDGIHVIGGAQSRGAFIRVSSDADQDRAIDALSPLDVTTPREDCRQLAEQLVVPGQSAVVSVISPITVAEALRTISFKQSYCRREVCRVKYYMRGENIGTETRCREFKLGRGDLDAHLPCAVSKYVSSFLNSEGGTLMLGVNDKGEVVGVSHIDHAREDRLRQQIDRIIAGIYPPVFPNAVGVRFVPVRQPDSDCDIPDCKVVEICTSQGQPGVLYQTPRGEVFLRRDGSVQGPLKASEIQTWTRQNEIQRQQHEDELLHLRERERQLQEELNMRRTMDAFNQRQIYQLLSDVEQLRRTNREQQDELDRLSTPVKQPESSPQAQESVIAPLPQTRQFVPEPEASPTADELVEERLDAATSATDENRRRHRDRDKDRHRGSKSRRRSKSRSRSSSIGRKSRSSAKKKKKKKNAQSSVCTVL